jgi:hypothetical protein
MSNTKKAAEKLVSSIRSGKPQGGAAGKKSAKKKAPVSGKASARKPSTRRSPAPAPTPREKHSSARTGRLRREDPGRSGYALGGLRWPD